MAAVMHHLNFQELDKMEEKFGQQEQLKIMK